jgi:hypothetical protein
VSNDRSMSYSGMGGAATGALAPSQPVRPSASDLEALRMSGAQARADRAEEQRRRDSEIYQARLAREAAEAKAQEVLRAERQEALLDGSLEKRIAALEARLARLLKPTRIGRARKMPGGGPELPPGSMSVLGEEEDRKLGAGLFVDERRALVDRLVHAQVSTAKGHVPPSELKAAQDAEWAELEPIINEIPGRPLSATAVQEIPVRGRAITRQKDSLVGVTGFEPATPTSRT